MPKPKFEYSEYLKRKPSETASDIDKKRFWEQEYERWHKGYKGLTGYHYFFLTQCRIKSAEGTEIIPFWRDVDEFIFEQYDKAIQQQADIIYVKRREVGLTTIFGGVIPICNSLIHAGSNNLITSADKDRIKNLFLEKTCTIYDNLDTEFQPSRANTRVEGFMFFAKKDTRTSQYTGLKSSIVCKETVDKPNAFETYRAKSVFVDEFFLHPKASEVRISAQACVKKGQMKLAPIVMGGSCGITSAEGMKEGVKIWQDAEALNIITVFIPGWMGISEAPELDSEGKPTGNVLNFCPNGYSDEKAATEWILKTRERLSKAQDKRAYLTFVKEYPLSIQEVFTSSNEGILPPEVMQNVQQQRIRIMNEPPPVMTYNLFRLPSGQVKSEPSPSGKFHILEPPRAGEPYLAGSDCLPYNTENIKEGSKYAIAIKKPLANTYVAYYAERNLNADIVIRNCIMLQDYYNRAKTMVETNSAGVTFKIYKDLSRTDLLSKRPSSLGIQFVDKKESFGYYKNEKTTQRGIELIIKYLINHCDKIWFQSILDEIPHFPHENTDLVDAMIACEFNDANLVAKSSHTIKKPDRKILVIERNGDGKTIQTWKTITT